MSLFDPEKLQNAHKANLDLLQQVSGTFFESVEQLSQLQFKTLKAGSEEHFDNLRKLFSAQPGEFQAALQPSAQTERLLEFNRQVYELVSRTQAEIGQLVERQFQAGSQQAQAWVEEVARNAPAGAEPAVNALKSALSNAESVYESAQKAAKQAGELAESGIAAATSAAREATGKPTGRSKA